MNKQTDSTYISLIEEDCQFLRQYLEAEVDKSQKIVFGSGKSESKEEKSAWKDYEQLGNLGCGVMRYSFDTPVELRRMLEKLWGSVFSEELILPFLAIVCKWGSVSINDGDK